MGSTVDEVVAALPHGPSFRFVSQLTDLQPGVRATGVWRVKGNEDFLKGHFPGNPIVPGVLLAEALAQVSGLVAVAAENAFNERRMQGRLAHVDVRLLQEVKPPADIVLKSLLSRSFGALHQFGVEALVHDLAVARGTITLAFRAENGMDDALK